MTSGGEFFDVEADLRADRARLPGGVAAWEHMAERKRRRYVVCLRKAEGRRAEFESLFAADANTMGLWRRFPVTEQREILSTIDYLRFWPARWTIKQALKGVMRGSDYRRLEASTGE